MSGGHCTRPNGGPAIRLKHKRTQETQVNLNGFTSDIKVKEHL